MGNQSFYELLTDILFIAVKMTILLSVTLVVIVVTGIAVSVHPASAVSAK